MPSSRFFALSFVLVLCFSLGSVVRGQSTELTVEDYCRLTISLMQLSVEEWQERVPVAEKIKTDRKKLETALQAVTKKYREQRTEKYQRFGMDQRAYLNFSTEHKTEIESYLEDNPEVQQAIDDLKKQIDNLIEQFESAATPRPEGAAK
jgi:FtsZ-binding cell division protein ZapB